ncbi:3391_t:CDS:2 [Diversispora eburnea]|uniref:3391_t:CDS:1 n=1 Tax=Diversispora eburnea TaxID=1213867 RepID=A0A9N8VG69_9GLOM|nr:3391_t:CDS:2 [Diversispora eburnea]
MSYSNSKYIIALLIVCLLVNTFVDSVAIPQGLKERSDTFKYLCGGFKFVCPTEGTKIKNGETIEFKWTKDKDVELYRVDDVELFTQNGLVKVLWSEGANFTGNSCSKKVKISVPFGTKLPAIFLFRSWGSTKNGPQLAISS